MQDKKHYVLVANSKEAMKLHQALQKNQIKTTIAPTPREADHCCGVCVLYFDKKDKEKIQKIAEEESINVDDYFDMENKDDPNRHKFC